jgi:hypothetical protein
MNPPHASHVYFSFVSRMARVDHGLHGMHILHASRECHKEKQMDMILERPIIALEPGQVVTLNDAQGVRIRATEGVVWVTYENSVKDMIVGPGETLTVARNGRTVVQALQPTHVALQ